MPSNSLIIFNLIQTQFIRHLLIFKGVKIYWKQYLMDIMTDTQKDGDSPRQTVFRTPTSIAWATSPRAFQVNIE